MTERSLNEGEVMGPFEVTYTLGDLFAVAAQSWRALLLIIFTGEALILVFIVGLSLFDGANLAAAVDWFPWEMLAWIALLWIVTFFAIAPLIGYVRAKRQGLLGPHKLWLVDTGVRVESSKGESLVYWSGFRRVIATRHRLCLFLRMRAAVVVPRSAFRSHADFENFATVAVARWKQGRQR